MTLKLTTTYQIEGGFYVAYCVELGVTSQGKTFEEAEKNLQEAVDLYLEDAPQEERKIRVTK
ncbi:MAG: type II toxin-antitoxin system HicB family antitoxin [Patescibacteria group bacterium]|jgi:predicted RNase H-like HicB family nuclease